ncbi:MAG: acetylglutamate kinase [Bacteroidota bacterium]
MSKTSLLVVKIGGNIVDDEDALGVFLSDFASLPQHKILVHGGGKLATELSKRLGIETKMVEGRRITDEETIKVVTMTYAGLINKSIVAKLQSKQCKAVGLSGADAQLIPAVKRPVKDIDYGWVGDVLKEKINTTFLRTLIKENITPVIAPISCDTKGHLLNINADTIAQSLAEAMSSFYAVTLIYCFEKNGLLQNVEDNNSVIHEINFEKADALKAQGVITDGMIPKIDNAFVAIQNGVETVIVGNALHIKQLAANEKGYGTRIQS